MDELRSQSWDEQASFAPDIVVTVCDSATQGQRSVWFGDSIQVFWELADPSNVKGTEEQKRWAFRNTIDVIKKRVQPFNSAAIDSENAKRRR